MASRAEAKEQRRQERLAAEEAERFRSVGEFEFPSDKTALGSPVAVGYRSEGANGYPDWTKEQKEKLWWVCSDLVQSSQASQDAILRVIFDLINDRSYQP